MTTIRMMLYGFAVSAAMLTGGCAPWVNIPAQAGDAAMHDPNLKTVQEVTVAAVKAVIADGAVPDTHFQLVLPEGTLPATYEAVTSKIGSLATWSADAPASGALFIEIRRVSIRSAKAEVDVLRPMSAGSTASQVVTVVLSWDAVTSWKADRVKVWRVRADDAMRTSPYDAPPELQR